MSRITWFLSHDTPQRRWAASLLSEAVGVGAAFVDRPPRDGAYVHHGSPPAEGRGLLIPSTGEVALDVSLRRDDAWWAASGDIVDSTILLVTDRLNANAPPAGLDRHGRLRAAAVHLGAQALEPVVNRYAALLAEALPAVDAPAPPARWPEGRRAAIGLSHDVDRPDKYAILRAAGGLRIPSWERVPWFVARTVRDLAHRLRDPDPDDFWLFDEVVAAEAERGMRSTFLFSVMPAYGAYGSTNDVLYDASWPHLRRAMRALRADGLEIGLHASYHAYRDPARFVSERERLRELSGAEIGGLRHHFWQVGPNVVGTLRAHEAAGFGYDSSLAFNDAVGLRRGIALPYRPWDPDLGRPLEVWQLPVLALDSATCTGRSVDEAVEVLWAAIEGVAQAGGVGVLDWHVRSSFPGNLRYRGWGLVYLAILDRLAQRSDIWTTGLGEIASWWRERAAGLRD